MNAYDAPDLRDNPANVTYRAKQLKKLAKAAKRIEDSTAERNLLILDLRQHGAPADEVAEAAGLSRMQVHRIVKAMDDARLAWAEGEH